MNHLEAYQTLVHLDKSDPFSWNCNVGCCIQIEMLTLPGHLVSYRNISVFQNYTDEKFHDFILHISTLTPNNVVLLSKLHS